MIEIKNSVFSAQGANKKDSVYGLTLSGVEDILVENCEFSNIGYSSILNNASANVTIKDCTFNCANVYNPIEGTQSLDNGNVTVEGCEFIGIPGNNMINFYQFKEGSHHVVKDCTFEPTVDNNIVRISNRGSHAASFLFKNCSYNYPTGSVPTAYTAFLICQDYTKKEGALQDFSKCSVEFNSVKRGNEVLNANSDYVYYTFENGRGVITGENDPVVSYK